MYYSFPLLAPAFLLLAASLHAEAQATGDNGNKSCRLWGQIAGAKARVQDGLDIELTGHDKSAKQKVHVSDTGNFEFRPVPPGEYRFRILSRSGKLVNEQVQWLGDRHESLLLFLPDEKSEMADKYVVSFRSLQQKTSSHAWKAFREAHEAAAAGDLLKCIRRLEEALSIDPDFAEAHSDLAAMLAKTGRVDEALRHAQTAFTLNPRLPEAGCNFAFLLVSLKRYPEAELTARRLLSGSYFLSELRGVLAISLIGQKRNVGEALKDLEESAAEIPFVRLLAARALVEIGRPDLGLNQVTAYLHSAANDCERADLETWVAVVQAQLASSRQSNPR